MTDSPAARLARARALIDLQRPAEAIAVLGPLVAEEPADVSARLALAEALQDAGRNEESATAAREAIALAPDHPDGHRLLALALSEMGGSKNSSQGRLAAREAVRLDPYSIGAWFALEVTELGCGDKKGARIAAEHIVELAPYSAFAHHAVGFVALAEHKWAEAEDRYRRALALQPDWPPALNNLGVALKAQKRHQEAIQLFASAARHDPTDEQHHRNVVTTAKQWAGGVSFLVLWLIVRAADLATGTNVLALVVVVAVVAAVYTTLRRRRLRQLPEGVRLALRAERQRQWWMRALNRVRDGARRLRP